MKLRFLVRQLDGIKQTDEIKQEQHEDNGMQALQLTKRDHLDKLVDPKETDLNSNLFLNGDFERTMSSSSYVLGWSCQGYDTKFSPMFRNNKFTKSGTFSGICVKRQKKYFGPGQFLEGVVRPGKIYKVTGWTYLKGWKTKEEAASLEMWIKYNSLENEAYEEKLLAKRDKYINNTGWQFWNSQFSLVKDYNYSSILLFFQGARKHIDILIDDMKLTEIPKYSNFITFTNNEIKKHRTRNVTVKITLDSMKYSPEQLAKTLLEVHQTTNDFGFGASIDDHNLLSNKKYKDFVKRNFEWATMENSLKWSYMEKDRNVIKHDVVDKTVDTLTKDMGMRVRGHCVYWAISENNPWWLFKVDKTMFKESLLHRMKDVVLGYKDRFRHWDVNNEMLHGWFYSDVLKPGIRNWMYKAAHKLDPNAVLFVNEFDVFAAPTNTQSYLEQIKEFEKKGVPISGIGVQGHFTGSIHPEMLRERLDILSKARLPIWITEFDIKEENETKRADTLEQVLRTAFSHPAVKGIIMWTFWDKHSWRGNHTSLFDGENFMPNSVGRRYLKLRQMWRTPPLVMKPSVISKNELHFNFAAYHGKHNFKVNFPDDQIIEKSVAVANHPTQLMVEFRTHVKNLHSIKKSSISHHGR